jgi:hypothetical protein
VQVDCQTPGDSDIESTMSAALRSRALWWIASALALVLLAFLVTRPTGEQRAAGDTGREASVAAPNAESTPGARTLNASARPSGPAVEEGDGDDESGGEPDREEAPPGAVPVVYPVNLEALRARLPDNLYWQLGAPSEDAEILARRADEEERLAQLFGKVQSNAASEEEIQRYYDTRRRISEDYVQFASLVLEEYGSELPDQDRGLYELSIKMHKGRLMEIPRQTQEALARKKVADQRRDEWRKSQGR